MLAGAENDTSTVAVPPLVIDVEDSDVAENIAGANDTERFEIAAPVLFVSVTEAGVVVVPPEMLPNCSVESGESVIGAGTLAVSGTVCVKGTPFTVPAMSSVSP